MRKLAKKANILHVRRKKLTWAESYQKVAEQIRKNHPDQKTFSAVELVRQTREEEDS